mgnify:CR=1 FL=1
MSNLNKMYLLPLEFEIETLILFEDMWLVHTKESHLLIVGDIALLPGV